MKIELAKNENIHFVGIGGIGMSGLALIMKGMGFKIQGSDISNNKNIDIMLKNILKMHQNKPLTDEEVKDLIWLPPVSTSRDFASYVTNR